MLLPVFCITNNTTLNISVHVSCSFFTSRGMMKNLVYLYYLLPSFFFSQLLQFLTFHNTGFIVFTFASVIITCPFVPGLVLQFNRLGAHHQSFWHCFFTHSLFDWSRFFNSSLKKASWELYPLRCCAFSVVYSFCIWITVWMLIKSLAHTLLISSKT